MTAKQYLQQSFRLNAKIDASIQEIEQLRETAMALPAYTDLIGDKVKAGSPLSASQSR